jgi:membrane fusion protein (multidrug efflux system)
MSHPRSSAARTALGSLLLLAVVGGAAFGIYSWKGSKVAAAASAAAQQHEMAVSVTAATARSVPYARTTTAIGTVRALRSITLRNELPGTVRNVALVAGGTVETGQLLVELDVAVETAQLQALQAEASLAESMLGRMERAQQSQGASAADVDRARAQRDMAVANVARLQAVIDQKRLRAPFAAKVGLVDLHPGQYLEPGTTITTLQGLDAAVHIEFAVPQEAAAMLQPGQAIEVTTRSDAAPSRAKILAVDARVDEATRNAWVRAELGGDNLPQPGASVRVAVPLGAPRDVVVVPVSALRKGPGGDEVFVLAKDEHGALRAQSRRVVGGPSLGDEVIVREGLAVGETVASEGSFKCRPGVLVQLAAPTAESAPATTKKGN